MATKKMQPAELTYAFSIPANSGTPVSKYIDIPQIASAVNRRLYQQGKCYYVSRVSLVASAASTVALTTLPDTWVTSNAWVKSKALWKKMNRKVLKDNPSVEGKWADFKVYFDGAHYTGGSPTSGPNLNLWPVDGSNTEVLKGEWNMSTFVLPQHNVDPTSGEVLAADEFQCHMLGANLGSAGAWTSVGAIQGYSDTRARVQADPDVPADMSESWMTQLTDDGSQEPELADNIEAQNDLPPYDTDDYPGGTGNYNGGSTQSFLITTTSLNNDKDLGFKAPLGLIKVTYQGAAAQLFLHLTPGSYKGLMATEVEQ